MDGVGEGVYYVFEVRVRLIVVDVGGGGFFWSLLGDLVVVWLC